MDSKWRETFILHSKTDEFKKQEQATERIISDALRRYKKPYIAFSGGKDSTCVLHLVLKQCPEVMVLHWDYGRYFMPYEIHKEILTNAKKIGVLNLRIETSEQYEIQGRNAKNIIGTEMIEKLIPQLADEGYDAVFVGLREQESVRRRLRLRAGRNLSVIPEIWPLQKWSWMDVWAYIMSNELPYASSYDAYAPILGWDRARFTTFFDPEFDKFGCSNIDGVVYWKYKYRREK